MVEPGVIRHAGNLPSHIGKLHGGISERVRIIAEVFTKAGLATAASDNIMKDIWKKLMANIGINAISALCNFRVGEIFDTPETKETILESIRLLERAGQGRTDQECRWMCSTREKPRSILSTVRLYAWEKSTEFPPP
jgi:2-dehydropantoate 2-reductase